VIGGARRWVSLLAAVVRGALAAGVVPASSAEAPSYRLRVESVGYSLPGMTASGLPVAKGVVAVDPKLIPLRTRLFIPGYGKAIATDVGTAVKGRFIDLWFPTTADARAGHAGRS
jgi:3D (Asp-Asp-Asp) domain-containing protein